MGQSCFYVETAAFPPPRIPFLRPQTGGALRMAVLLVYSFTMTFPGCHLTSLAHLLLMTTGALRESHLAMFSSRIVAARLNGSLDFFSLETHTALGPLQFRGQRVWARQVPAPGGWAVGKVSSQRALTWPVIPRAEKFHLAPHVQQQRHGGLSPDPHGAVCTSETHHGPEGCCRAPRDWEPGPHTESKCWLCLLGTGTGDGEHLGTVMVRLEVSRMNCGRDCLAKVESGKMSGQNLMPIPAPGVPPGGLVLSLHPAGPLGGHHNCVH